MKTLLATSRRQAELGAALLSLGADEWRYARTAADVRGVRAADLVLVEPALDADRGYGEALDEVPRIEGRDGERCRTVWT